MMKKLGIMSLVALTALATTATPVFAAESATSTGTEVTYTASSASTDGADWLASYPKKVVLSDSHKTAASGESMDFGLLDKKTSQAYSGERKVKVTVDQYDPSTGITMTGGTGTVTMGIADSAKTPLAAADSQVVELSKNTTSGKGYAYLKSTNDPEGSFSATVTFVFTDDSTN